MRYYLARWTFANGYTGKQIIYAESYDKVERLIIAAYPAVTNVEVEEIYL